MTDSPEAVAAKSEGWAAGKAKRQPMTPIAQARRDPFELVREYAGLWGKLVVRNLREIDMPDEEIDATRKRMMDWIGVVEAHDKAVRAVLRDLGTPQTDRSSLIRDMLASQEQIRREMFGR